jgi:hypothetical protein
MYPKSIGDKQVFREDFQSTNAVIANGGTLSGATVSNRQMTCTNGGAAYEFPEMDSFFTMGGTIRIVITSTDTSAAALRFFHYCKNNDSYRITVAYRGSDGFLVGQIQLGAGNYYYWITSIDIGSKKREIVLTWNPATTTLGLYKDGVLIGTDASAGAAGVMPEAVITKQILLGQSSSLPWVGLYHNCEIFLGTVWTASEVLDAYNNATYPKTDAKRQLLYLPMDSSYVETTTRTRNQGSGGIVLMGNGTTATSFPTIKDDPKCFYFDGTTDYLTTAIMSALSGISKFTLGCWVNVDKWDAFGCFFSN